MTLSAKHLRELQESGISESVIEAMGCYTETNPKNLIALGYSEGQSHCVPCLVFPGHSFDGNCPQIKPDRPFRDYTTGKPVKYMSPVSGKTGLSFIPHMLENILDVNKALWMTEGNKKMAAATSRGLTCLSLLGVWMWRISKKQDPSQPPLPEWDKIPLANRHVYLCFDSDVMHKSDVHKALHEFSLFLQEREAIIHIVYLPDGEEGDKTGLDDYLATDKSLDDLYSLADDILHPIVPDIAQDIVKALQKRTQGYAEVSACGVTFPVESQKAVDKMMFALSGVEGQVRGVGHWIRGDTWIAMKRIVERGHLWATFAARYGNESASKASACATICRKFPPEQRRKGVIPFWVFKEIHTAETEIQEMILDTYEAERLTFNEVRTIVSNNKSETTGNIPVTQTSRVQKSTFLHEVQEFLDEIPPGKLRELTWFIQRKGFVYLEEMIEAEKMLAEAQGAADYHRQRFGDKGY